MTRRYGGLGCHAGRRVAVWRRSAGGEWLGCGGWACSGRVFEGIRWPGRGCRGRRAGSRSSDEGCRSRRCSCPTSTTEVANVTADLDTRCGELYASGDELLPAGRAGSDDAVGGGEGCAADGRWGRAGGLRASREQFESLVSFLDGTDAAGLSHAELEERLDRDGRELLRRLLDDHLALRAVREQRLEQVVGDEGVARGRVESRSRARA